MNKNFKRAATVLSVLALTGAGVMGSLAYLQERSNTVTNTFTAQSNLVDDAKTQFTLKEHNVKENTGEYGYVLDTTFADGGVSYKNIVPGVKVKKDPTVYLDDLNVKSYLFIKENKSLPKTAFEYTVDLENWILVDEDNKVWVYKDVINPFTTADSDIDKEGYQSTGNTYNILTNTDVKAKEDLSTLTNENNQLEYQAYLVQADGFNNAEAAWTAAYGKPATPNTSESTGA